MSSEGSPRPRAYGAMTRACRDWRRSRTSIRTISAIGGSRSGITTGIPARVLAERAGHSKPSMSLDVYSHVMPLDEIPEDPRSSSS